MTDQELIEQFENGTLPSSVSIIASMFESPSCI